MTSMNLIFFDEFDAAMFLPHTDENQFPSVAALLEGQVK